MKRLKLQGMAAAYEAILALPLNQHPTAHEMIAVLIDAETQSKSQRRTELFLRTSKLRYRATLSEVQCSEQRNLDTQTISALADGSYITRAENILISGATGCGKSYLACALGNQACAQGFRTLYFNLNRLTEQIALAKAEGSLLKWLNSIKKANLLILDDFGIQPIPQQISIILLQILEDRYAKRPIVVASQLPVAEWYNYLGEPTLADAILDRLTANANRIELKGNSMRQLPKS